MFVGDGEEDEEEELATGVVVDGPTRTVLVERVFDREVVIVKVCETVKLFDAEPEVVVRVVLPIGCETVDDNDPELITVKVGNPEVTAPVRVTTMVPDVAWES